MNDCRYLRFFLLAWFMICVARAETNDGPLISITSPDQGSTFAMGTLKSRQLFWDKKQGLLIARVTYTNERYSSNNDKSDDTLDFRLPGIYLDDQKGIYWTQSLKGDVVPIAVRQKTLLFDTVKILPNAAVRLIRDHSNVTVILEAVRADDPVLQPKPDSPTETSHTVTTKDLLHK